MKKKSFLKKLVSVVLTAVLMLGIAVPVFAEPGDSLQTGSLTVNRTKAGETYSLYKIFDLTWSANANTPSDKDSTEGNHAYTINADFEGFFTDAKIGNLPGDTRDLRASYYVDSRANDLADFATELEEYIIENKIAATKVVAGVEGTTIIDGLLYGYYLLVPTDSLATDGLSALFSLDTVKPNATVEHKSTYPTVNKEIIEGQDRVESNNVSIGDTVSYEVTSFVPNMAGYETYMFYFTDTFDAGLTFNNDVAIKLEKEGKTKNLAASDFTVSQNGQVVTINLLNFVDYNTDWKGADVIVTYSAILNEKAIVGTSGNVNTVNLTYSSNPAVQSATKTTADDKVITYATSIALKKVDEEGNVLTGAQFELVGEAVNKTRVYGQKFVANATGSFYKLKDGSYTQTAANDATKDLYASTTQKYALVDVEEVQTKTTSVNVNGYVDANGKLLIEGLGEGSYQIKEMVAPNGYHLLAEAIDVKITCEMPENIIDGSEKCVWKVAMTNVNDEEVVATVADGVINLQVENQTDEEFPFTGGQGIALFSIVGILFVAAAAIVVVASKKKVTA